MKLTEKSAQVFEAIKAHGGRMSLADLSIECDRPQRSVNANVTDLCKKELTVREKEKGADGEKDITYVVLTELGADFVPTEED